MIVNFRVVRNARPEIVRETTVVEVNTAVFHDRDAAADAGNALVPHLIRFDRWRSDVHVVLITGVLSEVCELHVGAFRNLFHQTRSQRSKNNRSGFATLR